VSVAEMWKCSAVQETIPFDGVEVAMRTTEWEEICDEVSGRVCPMLNLVRIISCFRDV